MVLIYMYNLYLKEFILFNLLVIYLNFQFFRYILNETPYIRFDKYINLI